ncbi:MAG: DUF4135 domain-containing protein [Romboutsia sp.]|nr:DUF4135 domain-containing protein [Romboutsia sp.]
MPKRAEQERQEIKTKIIKVLDNKGVPSRHSPVIELLYDIVVPQLVYNFYNNNINSSSVSFQQFITLDNIADTLNNPILIDNISSFYEVLLKREIYWKQKVGEGFEYLGDLHDVVTKIKKGNNILYENILNSESYFEEIAHSIVPIFKDLIPEFSYDKEIISRKYIKYTDQNYDAPLYHYNFGLLLAFAFFFRMTDLHMENVVLNNNITKLFDFEFAYSPDYDHIDFGIMPTNLISYKAEDNISALLGGFFYINSYMKPILMLDDQALPEIIWKTKSNRTIHNIPSETTRKGAHPKIYVEDLLKVFWEGTKALREKKKDIINLTSISNFKVRQLVRPTRQYRYLIISYAYPQYHNKMALASCYDTALKGEPWKDFFNPIGTQLKDLEIKDCESLMIPYFYSEIRKKEVFHSSGTAIGKLNETPIESFLNHIDDNNYDRFLKRHITNTKRILTISYKKYKEMYTTNTK